MKKISGVLAVIASLVLVVAVAYGQQSSGQQSDTAMQQSDSSSKGASLTKDPQTIKEAQQALSQQGYDPGPADGKMGQKTKSALKKFQQSQGMQASGKLDQQTLAALGIQGAGSGTGGQQDMSSSGSGAGGQQDQESNQMSGSQQNESK
jgi:peptidoglycan hydrolase-like protein with peptidoglycan-binding domain